jgi:hypothetical protein
MTARTETPSLSSLEYVAYLNDGSITEELAGKIGVYAIFDRNKTLQYVGYSRDIYLSLKQHLIRQPQKCYWLKLQTIDRPSRQILEAIKDAWIAENGVTPAGNSDTQTVWTQAIDATKTMTEEEKAQYRQNDEIGQIKMLKKIARRVEAEIIRQLGDRGVTIDIRFNPKLKEKGLLDLK